MRPEWQTHSVSVPTPEDIEDALLELPIDAFLSELRRQDVKLYLDGQNLRVNAPAGTLTLELKRTIAHRKVEIIAALTPEAAIRPADAAGDSARALSFAQERLWFLDQLEGPSAVYNVPLAIRLRGMLVRDVLQRSLDALVERHAVLRTTFDVQDGVPVQTVGPPTPVGLVTRDLSGWPTAERERRLEAALLHEARRPFDLASGPLVRALLLELAEHECVLLLTMHHSVCDGWSLGIVASDLSALYAAFSRGESSPLAPLPIQYVDYAAWQRERLTGVEFERLVSYWTAQLAGAPTHLELPTDRVRPARASGRGEVVHFSLPDALMHELGSLARAEGSTLFMVLLASFGVLLQRHAHQDDILIGSPIAGRTRAELEGLIGLFVNTLALRVDLSGEPTFVELLRRVRETCLGAYAHQELPFEKLVEVLQPQRASGHHPLVQTMIGLHNAPAAAVEATGLIGDMIDVQTGTAKLDLNLALAHTDDGGVRGWLEYNVDLFERASMEHLVDQFEVLLRAVAADPNRPIAALSVLDYSARRMLLEDWNASELEYARDSTLADLVAAQTDRAPEAIAVTHGSVALSYRELDCRANRLAHYLRDQGVGPGTIVALSLERTLDMPIALLAVARAGAAYLPLDPMYPLERRAFMLRDSGAQLVLANEPSISDLPLGAARVVRLDDADDQAAIAACCPSRPVPAAGPDDLAYVIYTSGSTGTPKGVMVPHRAVVNLLAGAAETPGITATDTVLALTTLSFDIAVFDLWAPLAVGARVVLAPREAAADGTLLRNLLDDSDATIMQATPSTWRLLIDAGWTGQRSIKVISTGEALPRDLAEQLVSRSNDVWNMYGPTETTVWSTAWRVPHGIEQVLIGRPMANTRLYVLDASLHLVPPGAPGELYIGGDGVTDGYIGRPDLTRDRFVLDPFAARRNALMYRTGDVVRWRADGTVEYLGRNDRQVKLRGFRIELEEIEARLRQHSAVRDAAVVLREDTPGNQQLAAYVVAGTDAPIDLAELRAFARETLPQYMLPTAFRVLDELPLTPNGKVDRKALPLPDSSLTQAGETYLAPRGDTERRLVELWEELLGHRPIGIRDNFFDVGGHSLLAARLMFRIQATLGRNLPVATLLRATTVEELAAIIQAPEDAEQWDPLVILQRGSADRHPMFFVHGAFGDVLCYAELAQAMGPDQPCYVLQAIGLDGVRSPLDRVEDMAAAYIAEMRTVQPHGPYCLAGYSLGGTIVYEMACQLEAAGEQVALLSVFDHPLAMGAFIERPSLPVFAARFARSVALNLPHWLRMAARLERGQWEAELAQRARLTRRALSRFVGKHQPSMDQVLREVEQTNGLDYLREWPEYRRRVLEYTFRAMAAYRFRTYAGRMLLFRARRQPLVSAHDPLLGWGDAVKGGVDVVDVPGNHQTLLHQPYVQVLADHLTAALAAISASA